MWSDAESSWTLVFARPWRLRLGAVAAFFGWRRCSPRIAVSPMSDDWLRQHEAGRRAGDP